MVDVGAVDIRVFQENREVGRTGSSGRMLIPNLRGYEVNHLSIDPKGLGLNADIPVTSASVRPMRGSGILVAFGVRENTNSALIILQDAQGKALELGAAAILQGSNGTFTIGYDGEVYIQGLKDQNTLSVTTSDGECTASFNYSSDMANPVIGPIACL